MDDVVERVMASYKNHERQGREDIRVKVGQYLEKLASAGQRDVEELTYWPSLSAHPSPRSRSPLFKLLSRLRQKRLSPTRWARPHRRRVMEEKYKSILAGRSLPAALDTLLASRSRAAVRVRVTGCAVLLLTN